MDGYKKVKSELCFSYESHSDHTMEIDYIRRFLTFEEREGCTTSAASRKKYFLMKMASVITLTHFIHFVLFPCHYMLEM